MINSKIPVIAQEYMYNGPQNSMIDSKYFNFPVENDYRRKTLDEKNKIRLTNRIQVISIDSVNNQLSSNKSQKVELIIIDD